MTTLVNRVSLPVNGALTQQADMSGAWLVGGTSNKMGNDRVVRTLKSNSAPRVSTSVSGNNVRTSFQGEVTEQRGVSSIAVALSSILFGLIVGGGLWYCSAEEPVAAPAAVSSHSVNDAR